MINFKFSIKKQSQVINNNKINELKDKESNIYDYETFTNIFYDVESKKVFFLITRWSLQILLETEYSL